MQVNSRKTCALELNNFFKMPFCYYELKRETFAYLCSKPKSSPGIDDFNKDTRSGGGKKSCWLTFSLNKLLNEIVQK